MLEVFYKLFTELPYVTYYPELLTMHNYVFGNAIRDVFEFTL